MKNIDAHAHVRGESVYVDDIPERRDTLHGAVFASPLAHGVIKRLDVAPALACPGVVAVLTAADVPGQNQIGNIIQDEPLFAEDQVHFQGQPLALVLAERETQARRAVKEIRVELEPLPIIVDPRVARAQGELIIPPRTFLLGDPDKAFAHCAHVFEGRADTGGQEHLYIETQGAYAWPVEKGGVRVVSSTQGPTVVQRAAARVLDLPMHLVEISVQRLGGGFGGKEDQATAWAVMAALGALRLKRSVKIALHREDDLRMTGKRHPYSSDFKIGLDEDLKILAYEATFHQDAGAAADLSPAVMERTLFHASNSYFIPNLRATAYSCRTNLPPNTAFRGFGGPQGMFVIEAAIARAAEALGVPARLIQERNLLDEGSEFPYGQRTEQCQARVAWHDALARYDLARIEEEAARFNRENRLFKKGLALMPICFGIAFTKKHLNQAGALVHVYSDGSVGVSTGAVEMGQGVNTKLCQTACAVFSIGEARVKMEAADTTRVANTSPTAASAAADLNGKALEKACRSILGRLQKAAVQILGVGDKAEVALRDERVWVDGQPTDLTWPALVEAAYLARVNLSAHAHYATPAIWFDTTREKGEPFAYHVYGTAILEATVDCVRGTYVFDSVKLVHDFGKSMNPYIDRGQTEGGLIQGIGWMTCEEVAYDAEGRLLANALSTYKVPDIQAAPKTVDVHFLEAPGSKAAIFRSKAIGEPPLMYGIGAYFAVRNAIRAFNPESDLPFSAPITPEKTLLALYGAREARRASEAIAGAAASG